MQRTKAVQEKATEVEGQVPGQTRVSVRGSDPAPRTRPKNRKAQIAAAAAEAFSERGYHAVGIDEIAAKVGISGPALYRHFPTKYALFVYTVNNLTQALLDASDPAVHGNENPREQLNSTMVGVIRATIENRRRGGLYRWEGRYLVDEDREQLRVGMRTLNLRIAEPLAAVRRTRQRAPSHRTHRRNRHAGGTRPGVGELRDIAIPGVTSIGLMQVRGDRLLLISGGAKLAGALRELDLGTGELTEIRSSVEELPESAYLPEARAVVAHGHGREVHAVAYPPRSPRYKGPDDELPPYVAFVHGGPTAHVAPALNLVYAFFTSRGIGVVDVNYGGSTGYGREYRNRLRGQWGVVDVQDVVTAVNGLAEQGLADPARLAIEGGSAGGWTVLAALTTSDVFACGASYFGVAELDLFVQETQPISNRVTSTV